MEKIHSSEFSKGQVALRPFFRPQHSLKKITWFESLSNFGQNRIFFFENKKLFFSKKNIQLCSEFNGDSNHVIFFKELWERKNRLTATCPFIEVFSKLKCHP
jgi:hypothetical protein